MPLGESSKGVYYDQRLRSQTAQITEVYNSVALGHCVRHSPEMGAPSDRNCSRASLHSDVVSSYCLEHSAISI